MSALSALIKQVQELALSKHHISRFDDKGLFRKVSNGRFEVSRPTPIFGANFSRHNRDDL